MDCKEDIREYRHSPLREDCFRVIELESIEPRISVRLVEYPDEYPPEYFALSYAWGSQTNTNAIVCDAKAFKLTQHLEDGLKQIFAKSNCRKLCVDAICIDQTSAKEKEIQVAKMHHIYRRAAGVYVWLGEAEDNSDEAISAINAAVIPEESDAEFKANMLKPKSKPGIGFSPLVFKPLAALSRRSWFRRLWIAQEYFFGRTVGFFCGQSTIEGVKFLQVLRKLTIHSFGGTEPAGWADEPALFKGFEVLRDLEQIKKMHNDGSPLSFYDFVMLGRERFGKEPVDRIYAAYGMAENVDAVYRHNIVIDYSDKARSEYWKLYVTFGKIALLHEPHLRLLSAVSFNASAERPASLPSWCPNLNAAPLENEFINMHSFAAGWFHWKHPKADESAASSHRKSHTNYKGRTASHVSVSPDSDSISIWGAKIGNISTLGPPCEWTTDVALDDINSLRVLAKDMLKWLQWNERFCRRHCADTKTSIWVWGQILGANFDESGAESFSDTEEAESSYKNINLKLLHASDLTPYVYSLESPAVEREDKIDINQFLPSVLRRIVDIDPNVDWQKNDERLLMDFELVFTAILLIKNDWSERVLFATDSGHLGIAPIDSVVGDSICMLYNGKCLYNLRKKDDSQYELVGEVYVLNCMNGQVFDMMHEEQVHEEVFRLI